MDGMEYIRESWLDTLARTSDWFESKDGKEDIKMSEQQYKPGDLIWWSDKWVCSGYYPPIKAMFIKKRNTAKRNCGIAVLMADHKTWIPKWVSMEYIEKRDR